MRSLLFVPGDSERKIAKAMASDADVLIFDLEDSVSPDRKDAARRIVAERLAALDPESRAAGPELWVRVNALDTGLTEADLDTVMPARPHGIMQPKTLTGADATRLAGLIDGREAEGGATGIIVVATETATSLFHMGSYAGATPRLRAMTWGAEDLSADLGAATNKDEAGRHTQPYVLARTLCLLGAVSARVEPVDTVFVNFHDIEGLRAECADAMRDGFTGKLAIHPDQVSIINEVFTPSRDQVERARRIVDAFALAGGDVGVIGLDGEMLDRPHLARAEKLLARARRYAPPESHRRDEGGSANGG